MASEYDALLKAAEPSPYDALLQDAAPESDYDALLSAAEPLSVPSTMKAPEVPDFPAAPSESTASRGATVEGARQVAQEEEARRRYEQAGRDFLKNKEFDESPGAYAQRRSREAAGEKDWFQARKRTPMENLGDLNFTIKRFTTLPVSRLLSNETAAEAFGRDVLSAKSSIDERAKVEEIKAKKSAGAQLSPAEDEVLKADETVEKIKAAGEAIKGQPVDVAKAILRDAFENAPLYYGGSRFVRLAAAPLASIRGISSFVAKAGKAGKAGKIGQEIAVEAAAAPLTGAPIAASMGQEYGTVDWLADVMASSVVGSAVGGGQVISDALRARALKPAQAKYAVGAIDRLEKSGKVTKQVADDARRVLREEAVSTEVAARKAASAPQAAAQANLLGGEQAVKSPVAAPVQSELLPSTPPQVSSAPIGAGRPDAGLEGLPMQEAADAALRAQVETDLFAPKPPTSPKLPKNLEGAKPRYNYGPKGYTMKFDSDVDRALFIVSQKTKSKADDQYRAWLRESVGLDDAQIDAQAAALRNKIKPLARDGEGGELQIASSYAPKPAAAAQAAPARAAETAPRVRPEEDEAVRLWREKRTESPYFKKWFGDSKVVDAEGKPLVVYHGTNKDFEAFDPSASGTATKTGAPEGSFFFTNSPEIAEEYASIGDAWTPATPKEGGAVSSVFLDIKKPLEVDAAGSHWTNIKRGEYTRDINEIIREAKKLGEYDGVIVKNVVDRGIADGTPKPPSDVYVAFSPTQIKSATGNSGRFDPANPSITDAAGEVKSASSTASHAPAAADAAPTPKPGKKYVKKGDLERWNDLKERKAAEKHLRRVTGVRKIDPDRVTTFLRELGDNPMPRPEPKLKPQPLPEPAKAYEFFGNRVLADLPDKQTGTIRLYDADFGSLGLKKPGGEVDLAEAKRLFGGKKVELLPGKGSVLAKRAEAFNEARINPASEGGVVEYWIPPDDPQWADIEFDPDYGLNADDVAAAIINRPRGKAAERDARLEAYNRSPERRAELEAEAMESYAKELETSGQLERLPDGEFVPRSPEAAGFIGKSSYFDESGNLVDAATGDVIVRANPEPAAPDLPDVDPEMPANALTAGDDGGAGQVPPWPPAGGTPPNPDAPRIEQDVARFREIEQELGVEAARLARDEARSFAMLDGEARKMAEEWTPEQFGELASQRMLTDAEKVAATAQAKRAETEAEIARRKIDGAMEMGDEAGEASARLEYLGATSESLGLLAATINDATATARALNARKRIIEAARKGPANPDEVALKMLLDMDIDEASAVDLVKIFKEDPSKFREILENMMQFGIWDKVRFYYKSALLSAIGTQGVNFIGNTLEQAALMAETFGSGVFDKILSGSDIASGRARYASEAFAEAAGARAAWPAAFAKLKSDVASTLRLEPGAISMNESFELQVNPIKGTFGKVVGVPFRVLQAMDEYTKTITQGAELSRLAMRRAQDELGDAPKELLMRRAAEISREIIDDPVKNADVWSKIEARKLEATFQERPGKIVEAIMEMERQGGALGALTLAAVPFKKTPANIFRRAYKRSPLGFDSAIRAAKKWQAVSKKAEAELMGARDKGLAPAEMKKLENRLASEVLDARGEVADALSRAALGSALFAGVFGAAAAGLITGANPKDANKREALEATGWQPYSLVIPIPGARNVYIPLRRISGALAPLLGVAADIANAVGDDTREQNLASVALASTMTNLQEQSYLQGVENVVDAFSQPERKLGYWLSGTAAGFVPNIVGSVARAVDPVRRDMRPKTGGGVGGGVEQLGNAVMARLPFVSKAMAPRYSPYGYALQRAGGGDPGSSLERFVSPAPTSSSAEYSLEKELLDAGYAPETIPTSLKVGDVSVKLTQPEIDYLAGQRRVATERLRAKTATAWWKRMPPEKRVEKAKEHFSSETSATNARLRPVLKRRLRAAAKQSD